MQVAAVQMDVTLADVSGNLGRMKDRLREARQAGSALTVFPECAVTGYCLDSLEEARSLAQPIPGPATEEMVRACAETGGSAVFGLLEADGEAVFNAAVLVDGSGVWSHYRKVHLPYLGADRFTSFGDRAFAVHEVADLRLGLNICYDAAFPEAARCLALLGADLIVLPTNWPPGAESLAEHALNTRAMENGVYYLAANRVGRERGFDFIGLSRICGPGGETLAVSQDRQEEILYAEIDSAQARDKRAVRKPGEHAIDRLADRRPEMYTPLIEPHSRPRPGREAPAR